MAHLELVRCRLAIQCCIGYFPDGRERHRTFSLRDVRPDASADALASVVRAIAPLLAHPITKVSIVKKYVLVPDGAIVFPAPRTFRLYNERGILFRSFALRRFRHGCSAQKRRNRTSDRAFGSASPGRRQQSGREDESLPVPHIRPLQRQ